MEKTQFYPIRCDQVNMGFLTQNNLAIANFPCTYLGLPLHIKKLPKILLLNLIQKIANHLPSWKRNFLTYPGRELLVKMVLSAMPTFFLTVFKMPRWGLSKIDRFRRSFLWRGQDPDNVKGGHCLVNRQVCTRPKKLGGLGIKDLDKFSRALRLRWLWYNWNQVDRPWKHLLRVSDHSDRQLFFLSTIISLGNGQDTPFWEAKWLNGMAPKEVAPNLFEVARYKKRYVKTEMQGANWIRNLIDVTTFAQLEEFTLLFMPISSVHLSN
jgi:hypothetical protein